MTSERPLNMIIKFYTSPKILYPQNKFLATPLIHKLYFRANMSFRPNLTELLRPWVTVRTKSLPGLIARPSGYAPDY